MKKKSLTILLTILWMVFTTASSFAIDVSVKDFGAKGDGKTDDRLAIQATIEAVNKAGGGIVNFPEGIYIVTAPNKGQWQAQLKLCNNLKLQGKGMYKSVIKIADNQDSYDVILSGDSISGFSMIDLGIDANGATNPVVSKTDNVKSPWLHALVYLSYAKDIAIQRCHFTNFSGVWAIYGLYRAENMLIDACLFDNIGGYTLNDWDHSCIRIDGYGPIVVSNNTLTSRFGSGTTGARTAIELHGSNIKFNNNHISGFRYGINVCSGGDDKSLRASAQEIYGSEIKSDIPSVHQYYMDNTFVNVGSGFCIWGIDSRKFDDLVFERNDITIDVTGWKKFWPDFGGIEIVSYSDQEPPEMIENLRIVDNHITYINSEGGTNRSFGMKFDFGVFNPKDNKWSVNPNGKMKNAVISRNIISGAYWTGMYFNCVASNLEISDNIIIDPAKGTGTGDREWQCAIKLTNSIENVRILDNAFYIHTKPLVSAIYDTAANQGKCVYLNNRISGERATGIPIYFSAPGRKGEEWNK